MKFLVTMDLSEVGEMQMHSSIVEMRNITKVFGRTSANEGIDLILRKGEVHALLGENGAGKSTLMNILYGRCRPSSGEIFIRGEKKVISGPRMAIRNGIGMVHQHFMLIQPFTVLENIILGMEPVKDFRIDLTRALADVDDLSRRYGLRIDPLARIRDISVAMQQRTEILKALYRNAEVLILDEPTAVLPPHEIKGLIMVLRKLAREGKTVVLITHKLQEVRKAADVCTVLRMGRRIFTVPVSEVSDMDLAEKMVGRKLISCPAEKKVEKGPVVFRVEGLSVFDDRRIMTVKGVSLEVHSGEILGLIGVDGNGQTELVEAVTGLRPAAAGKVILGEKDMTNRRPREIIESGIGFIPEDRQKRGLVPEFSVAENLILKKYYKPPFARRGLLNGAAISAFAAELVKKFDIRPESESTKAKELSGGNQQKVILAREISSGPELLIAVQPTRGLDIGAAEYIFRTLEDERNLKKAVLLVTLDMDEVLRLSDRIAVIFEGRILGMMEAEDIDKNRIGILMAGGRTT